MASADADPRKRTHEHIASSPTGVTPPHSRPRSEIDFTHQLVNALCDPRVVHTLTEILVKPLLDQLAEKETQINDLTNEVKVLKGEVNELKNSVDELEQYGRRNAVRIWSKSMTETPGEDTDEIVRQYARKAGVDLPPNSIGRSHRVGRPSAGKVRPIIVKFTGYNIRRLVYGARKSCPDVFVSEDLTRTRSRIYYNARQERTAGRFKHCWTTDGRINIRFHDDTIRVITTQAQLDCLIDEYPIAQPRR